MSVSLNNFIKECSSLFPDNLPKQACLGFLGTAAISLLGGATLKVALIGGTVALAASVINATAQSIIQTTFKNNRTISNGLSNTVFLILFFDLKPAATNLLRVPFHSTHYLVRWTGIWILNHVATPKGNQQACTFIL